MKRVKLTVSYDGTNYCGWQFQSNGPTIEGELNKALTALFKEPIMVIGASRTDSGVHAMGNVAVFDTASRMPADKICIALNQRLPDDVRIQKSEEVPATFHPRKVNCRKTYEYKIMNRRIESPLNRLYSHFCYYELDVERMKQAASFLLGEHDFKSFCTTRSHADETVRIIYGLDITETDDLITIRICGSGFLYNMVRIIAGTLLQVGRGSYAPEHMEEILEARDRAAAGPTISAKGLTLLSLEYETERKPEISGQNKHWHYCLDQREVERGGPAKMTLYRSDDTDFNRVIRRVVHQAVRNGATEVWAKDVEKGRIAAGDRFGFYVAGEVREDGWFPFFYQVSSEDSRPAGWGINE